MSIFKIELYISNANETLHKFIKCIEELSEKAVFIRFGKSELERIMDLLNDDKMDAKREILEISHINSEH